MKKRICFQLLAALLAVVLLCSGFPYAKAQQGEGYVLSDSLRTFFENGGNERVMNRTGALFMAYVSDLENDPQKAMSLGMLNVLYEGRLSPDKDKCKEVLVNVMKTYESNQPGAVEQQQELDNLKTEWDYLLDMLDFSLDMVETTEILDAVREDTAYLMDTINTWLQTKDDQFEALDAWKMMLQNYQTHDAFLQLVEDFADGHLKEAAAELRTSLAEMVALQFQTYQTIIRDTGTAYLFLNMDKVFSSQWKDLLNKIDKQSLPTACRWLVSIDTVGLKINDFLKLGWSYVKMGVEIGKTLADLVFSVEDLLNRITEMQVLYTVNTILEAKLFEIKQTFPAQSTRETDEIARQYYQFCKYLFCSRIRGQYCMTSLFTDNQFIEWITGEENVQLCINAYDNLSLRLQRINREIDSATAENDLSNYHLAVSSGNYAIYQGYRYYTAGPDALSPTKYLCKEQIATGEKTVLRENTEAMQINVAGDKVFYAIPGSYMYSGVHMVATDGSGYRLLSESNVMSIVADDTYVYFAESSFLMYPASIKRICHTAYPAQEETIVTDSGFVRNMSLAPGKLVYSAQPLLTEVLCEVVICDLETKTSKQLVGAQISAEEFQQYPHRSLWEGETMWVHGDYVYLLQWGTAFGEAIGQENLDAGMQRVLTRYCMPLDEWEVCRQIPPAGYYLLPGTNDYYQGELLSELEWLEESLLTDFRDSEEYTFQPA